MYEKVFTNLRTIIFSVVLLLLLLWGGVSNIKLYSATKHLRLAEQRLDELRTELSNAQDRERELTETVGNIRGITERTDTILDQSGTTVQSIREKISLLEEYFDRVNLYLSTSNNDNNNIPNSEE